MYHQFDPALAGGAAREARHLHAHYFERRRYHPRLDPADEILVSICYAQGAVKIDTALRNDIRDRRQPGLADMQEGNYLGMAMRQDMTREPLEGGAAGAARIHDRRDARMYARDIGIDPEPGEPLEHVSVKIDQAGCEETAVHLDYAACLLARDRRRD